MQRQPYYKPETPWPWFRRQGHWIKELFRTLLMVTVIYTLLNLATPLREVEGSSMEPNFHNGQRLFINRVVYMTGKPQRGDVVVIRNPINSAGKDLIKRIVGLPGETITIAAGRVFINGVLIDEPYIKDFLNHPEERTWRLGPDEYFVLGDNRNHSNDSFDFGPIKQKIIIGRAWISYWPPQHLGLVPEQDYNTP